MRDFISRLAGGKRQSIGESNAVAQEVRDEPHRAAELWEAVWFPDPLVQMRAVDALEKVSAAHPDVLLGHEAEVLEDMPASELPEVRWHVGLLIPRLELDGRRLRFAAEVLDRLMGDPSRLVQVNALDGIIRLADQHPKVGDLADAAMTRAAQSPHASLRARARRLSR